MLHFRIISLILFFIIVTETISRDNYEIRVLHRSMASEIGKPAIIIPGDNVPEFFISTGFNGTIKGEVVSLKDNTLRHIVQETVLAAGLSQVITINENFRDQGTYKVGFIIKSNDGEVFHETFYFSVLAKGKIPRWFSSVIYAGENGYLNYTPDYRGNHIPDFSTAGYMGGGVTLPDVPVKVNLGPVPGDDTERIQEAIDYVASLEPGIDGFRGAVKLSAGIYEVSNTLQIRTSGIVLRGEGSGDIKSFWLDPSQKRGLAEFKSRLGNLEATLIIATGRNRLNLINIGGTNGLTIFEDSVSEIIDQYVPVGAKSFRINNPEKFAVGDRIIIQRRGNADWISEIGMDNIPQSLAENSIPPIQWSPFNINYENTITAINGSIVSVQGAILCAIEQRWGGGRVLGYDDDNRITNVGVENIRAISFWEPDQFGSDHTNHFDRFVTVTNTRDAWIRDVAAEHFFSLQGAFNIDQGSRQITVQNSSSLIAGPEYYSGPGYRHDRINVATGVEVGRYGFHIRGQSVLVVGCYAENNRRSFVVGPRIPGPTVFLNCKAENSISTSEPHHRWSTGGLYDNVQDNISIINRLYHGTGHGWAGANYVAWNTRGGLIVQQPPTAQNWSVGHKGNILKNPFEDFEYSEGYWEMTGLFVLPRSLYIQQLKDRLSEPDLRGLGFSVSRVNDLDNGIHVLNYPNPADYFTIFAFSLEKETRVRLAVFSLNGVLLSKVDFGSRDAGYHELIWETTDDLSRPLDNGIYIYQFEFNSHLYSNRLLINR